MTKPGIAKRLAVIGGVLAVFAAGIVTGANTFETPKSVLHIMTVQWKSTATAEQKAAAIDGVRKMAAEIPGVKSVWLKTLKVQPGDYNNVIVMEFKDQAAFDHYADNPAHRAWETVYLPVREESRTHDVTN
jgi:hypothetical protein